MTRYMDMLTETYFADVDPQFMPDEPSRSEVAEDLRSILGTAFDEIDDCMATLDSAYETTKNPNVDYQTKNMIKQLVEMAGKLRDQIEGAQDYV